MYINTVNFFTKIAMLQLTSWHKFWYYPFNRRVCGIAKMIQYPERTREPPAIRSTTKSSGTFQKIFEQLMIYKLLMSVKEITELLEKVNNDTLTSTEIAAFAGMLQENMYKRSPGFENVSKDDVQWFQTYSFVLNKLELFYKGEIYDIKSGGDWRQAMDDVRKLKLLVDELEEKKLVNEVAWFIDGISLYNITEPEMYKKQIFEKVRASLEKIMD